MKTVNLLPQWYLQQQRDRASLHFRLALMSLLLAAMGVWHVLSYQKISILEDRRNELARQGEIVRNLDRDLRLADGEIRRLDNLQLAYRDLGNTIPMSALLQQLPNNMTPGMALSRIHIDVRPDPQRNAKPEAKAVFHNVARITVVGIAPNDVLIAQLIGKISSNPLFCDVTLNYTRTETVRDYSVRRFEIQMQMDLDRLTAEEPPALQQARSTPTEVRHEN